MGFAVHHGSLSCVRWPAILHGFIVGGCQHDWKGLPTGESRYVMMFFVAYVGACFLPLFGL